MPAMSSSALISTGAFSATVTPFTAVTDGDAGTVTSVSG